VELRLTKHQGAGNDFLVVVDPDDRVRLDGGQVRALCDRHFGVGADGVIRVGRGQSRPGGAEADLWMELRNADGGSAEMSGNGIRCLAQAAVDAGLVAPGRFTVATLAGVRTVTYVPGDRPGTAWASVDMGPVRLGPEVPGLVGPGPGGWGSGGVVEAHTARARRVDVGNPHLVLFGPDDPDDLAVTTIGPRLEAGTPGGVNVEFIAPGPGPDELRFRVWERGVGETLACGTGSCAAAGAARSWGLVGDRVLVHNHGGTLEVRLGATDDDPAVLAGPTQRVAEVTVDLATLAGLADMAVPDQDPVPVVADPVRT